MGIDAPESRQSCTRSGEVYRGGQEVANHLDGLAQDKIASCAPVGRSDRYRRVVAICSVSTWLCLDRPCIPSIQLNELMVADGQAVDYPRYSRGAYARLEADARRRRVGVWGGEFQKPWEWRAR